MIITWAKEDQYLPPTFRRLCVGNTYDTEELGVSDETARAWAADGFAVRPRPQPEPIPEPIEEPIELEVPAETEGAEAIPKPKRYTKKATKETIGG